MKKSVLFVIIGAVIVAGGIVYLLLSGKSSDNASVKTGDQSQNKNTAKNSSNFDIVKDEKLEGKLVDSFPKNEVPLYPGEIVSSLGKMNSDGDRGEWNVAVKTNDSLAAVDASIREAYEADNWSIATESKTGMGGTMLIARSNKHTATITYDDMGTDGILINYGVSQR
ncbi:MAG TPA: hypothetical protein PKC86_02040 [Candidatus Saccharibacteria bacterium]|nr:hypothetical protein [Candidatus Saccharibacteria bacterium]